MFIYYSILLLQYLTLKKYVLHILFSILESVNNFAYVKANVLIFVLPLFQMCPSQKYLQRERICDK